MIHLDTHVAVWLYAGLLDRFPPAALELLETEPLAISPMAVLELQYLHEIGRVALPAATVVDDLANRIGLEIAQAPFPAVATTASTLSWTRDPFDRLIAAQAITESARLLTADDSIREHLDTAVWE